MASIEAIQQQLQQSHEQVRQLAVEMQTVNRKVDHLHSDALAKDAEIAQLKQNAASGGGGYGGKGAGHDRVDSLVNMKSMAPKVFSGAANESFKTWTKKVRAYCNSAKPGFKRFLKWIEAQDYEIDPLSMRIDWKYKESASDVLYDFLTLHTADAALILVELTEDNGPEAWRQLCRRYDPIGEGYVLDQMTTLMNVQRCKHMIELPAAISRWEKMHANYVSRSGGASVPEDWKLPLLFKMIPQASYDDIKLRHRYTLPQDKGYQSFSRVLIELANEKAYESHLKGKGSDDMDLDAADPHDGQKYTAQEWAEWAEWMASDEYEKEEPQEDLDYLGKGGGKGGKGKGKKGKGGKSGKGKGCHWCGDEDHFKADCPKFKAWKKKKDEERAARGEKPFEPRARQAPLKSMDAVIDIDDGYVGFGMLEEEPELVPLKSLAPEIPEAVVVSSEVVVIHKVAAKKARVSGPAFFPADFAGDCYELTVSQRDGSSSTAEYVSREVAPPTDEPAAAKHDDSPEESLAPLDEESDDDDCDDGDFREMTPLISTITREIVPDPFSTNDPWLPSEDALPPWKKLLPAPTSVVNPISTPKVPSSWGSPSSAHGSLNSVETMTDRICREIEEMQSKIPKATSVIAGTTDSPTSVYNGMLNKSVVADIYRSPADKHRSFRLDTPGTEKLTVEMVEVGVQTEVSLSLTLDSVEWTPGVIGVVVEAEVVGNDAKIDLAMRAQERDELPEKDVSGEESEDEEKDVSGEESEDEEETEGEEEENTGTGDGKIEEAIGGIGVDEGIVVEDTSPSVAEKIEEIEERSLPLPPDPVEGFRKRRNRSRSATPATSANEEELLPVGIEEQEEEIRKDMKKVVSSKIIGCIHSNCGDPKCGKVTPPEPPPNRVVTRVKMKKGITMDTGAHHNVMPRRMAGRRPIRPSPGSRAGLKYVGCGGEKMKNEGEVDIPFESLEGHKQSMIFQIAEINKPLGSVAYFVDRDYRVVFDQNSVTGEDLSYMVHKPTRTVYRFRRERNIWIMDAILDVADLYGDFSGPE